jgi:hypothetical protein
MITSRISPVSLFIMFFSLGALFSFAAVAGSEPLFIFDGKEMRGSIKPSGCRSDYRPPWNVDYVDGKIVGSLLSAGSDNDDPSLTKTPQHFSLPVSEDGSFGATSGDGPHRLWLRWWASKSSGYGSSSGKSAANYSGRKAKYQWVSGKVHKNGDIQVRIKWGTADNHGACSGKAFFKVGTDPSTTISNWIDANDQVCSKNVKEFTKALKKQIEEFRDDELIDSELVYSKFLIKKLYKKNCS